MARASSQPERQAWDLAYAMQARPTPALASLYFESLKRMLGDDPAANHNTNEGTACRKTKTSRQ